MTIGEEVRNTDTPDHPGQIQEQLAALGARIDEGQRLALERERVIDRLHEEVQRLRAGELQQALMPLIRDLIRLHDDLLALAAHREDAEPFRVCAATVLDILARQDVEPFEAVPGEAVEPRLHRAARAISAPDAASDRTIAASLRPGFRRGERVIRAADVEVFRFQPEAPQPQS